MCCSMTCWDCMIMQDSDIIVSSRPHNEGVEQRRAEENTQFLIDIIAFKASKHQGFRDLYLLDGTRI